MAQNTLHAERTDGGTGWLLCLLLAVLFTPTIRIPGNIPLRLDDILVFGAGTILIGRYLLWLELPRLDAIFFYTFAVAGTILLSTLAVPDGLGLQVTAKDYLDILRPIKFLLVYWLVRECNSDDALRTFTRTISNASLLLLGIVCIQMVFARIAPASVVVRFFSAFTERPYFDTIVRMMAAKPFGTFNTPTDLGYISSICLFAGPLIRSPRRRNAMVAASFLILLFSVTRTLLFALPLLIVLHTMLGAQKARDTFKRLRFSLAIIALAGLSSAVLLPLISPQASGFTQSMIASIASGDIDDQESITTRLDNLELVSYTWSQAPAFGVGSRTLLPDFVDSELIMTFHRYGIVGMAAFLLIYPLGVMVARQAAIRNKVLSRFVIMVLATTFLIGITQGALSNSRTGVMLFVILGLAGNARKWNRARGYTERLSSSEFYPQNQLL